MSKVHKSLTEWQEILAPEVFNITRLGHTERPFTGELLTEFRDGKYLCACCQTELFDASTKFDSHCGWPSFFADQATLPTVRKVDQSHGMLRVEICCPNCDAHLGHVFEDGPKPTGERFCINSRALNFKENK